MHCDAAAAGEIPLAGVLVKRSVYEQTELIKWWDVLDKVVEEREFEEGMAMARKCEHPDARWLVALCPSDDHEDVTRALEACPDDPRAMFLLHVAAYCGEREAGLMRRAAELGYVPAQVALGGPEWAQRAVDQGDRTGMTRPADRIVKSCERKHKGQTPRSWSPYPGEVNEVLPEECAAVRARALALYAEAAELGSRDAQYAYAEHGFTWIEWQRYHWLGRASSRGHIEARRRLTRGAGTVLHMLWHQSGSGRAVFDVGGALPPFADAQDGSAQVCYCSTGSDSANAVLQCVGWHRCWCEAREAVDCWSLGALRQGL